MTVSFEVPADIAGLIAVESTTLERVALEALAAEGYRCGSISESEVRRLLGFESRFDVHAWLKHCGIPYRYSEADLEDDPAALSRLGLR